jgi:hypothetical protein
MPLELRRYTYLALIRLRAKTARSTAHPPKLGLFIDVGERVEAFTELFSITFRGL